jgi:hypothetical protein
MRYAFISCVLVLASVACAQTTKPAGVGKFPNVTVDVQKKQVRVDCEVIQVDMRLEFFCVGPSGPDHETLLRTAAKPSDIHTGLLMLGLAPGEPMKYSPATEKWTAPHGPPLHITIEYQKDGQTVSVPANRMIRNAETKKNPGAFTWVFTGSRVMDDGKYAADITGYVVSLVNFDLTMIDVPNLASNSNDLLEWEFNPDTVPKTGTKVVMVIEPSGKEAKGVQPPAGIPAAVPDAAPATTQPAGRSSDVRTDEQAMAEWKAKWETAVRPNAAALKQAAQAHYDAINAMRKEQQRLINEADRIQRVIDQLEKDYQDMTTPHPKD